MNRDELGRLLPTYVGGELEIQNGKESYLYRGEVAKAEVDGDDIKVKFAWLAKGKDVQRGIPAPVGGWIVDTDLFYEVSLVIATPSQIGEGRLCLNVPITGELATFFPPNGSKLDKDKVEGLREFLAA